MWDPTRRPPPDVCPEEFCFHWVTPGGFADTSGRVYESIEHALAASPTWTEFPAGGCKCSFGECSRHHCTPDAKDWYEPHEPALEAAGLPWFYFVREASLTRRSRERFEREARALWGDDAASDAPPKREPE